MGRRYRGYAGKFVHGYGSVRNFPTMHPVMYEEIACDVLGQGNYLIIVPFRGPLGIRLGKVSVVAAARDEPSRRDWRTGARDGARDTWLRYRRRRD